MLLLLLLSGCQRLEPGVHVVTTPALAPLVTDAVSFLDDPRVTLLSDEDPLAAAEDLPKDDPLDIVLLSDPGCVECFTVEQGEHGFVVRGGVPLGLQYGLADVLERHGYRFYHPWRTLKPATITLLDNEGLGQKQSPEQQIRGLDPHTLHPIEALFDLWVPSDSGLTGSQRMIDWLIKNRGNHLQWPGLDNITGADHAAWKAHTQQVLDYAHGRGVRVGLGVQLFGGANLQQAFDLLDEVGDLSEQQAAIDARLHLVLDDLPFDTLNLSFGEFSGEDPEAFIASLNLATERANALAPGIEVSAVIHVGEMEDTYVEYQGERMIYYFLVKYADPRIVPYIHTVMYYNLFEDAGLAYGHEDFSDHRAWLEERLGAGQPVTYFPESAYWVAFDTPVPVYLPLYVQSRWTDMDRLRDAGLPLTEHVLFSSGWEWGYWQNDVATLRFGYELPDDWRDSFTWMYAPYGNPAIAEAIISLTETQHTLLIGQRLAPWLAGRDSIMDLGRNLGIIAQPDRPSFDEIVAMSAQDRDTFRSTVIEPLDQLATVSRAAMAQVPQGDDWLAELVDGMEIDALRAEYMRDTLTALLQHAEADTAGALTTLDQAAATLVTARAVVARRHQNLHDPDGATLIGPVDNPTIYDFGYLYRADTLCFWERDQAQADKLIRGDGAPDPGCGL